MDALDSTSRGRWAVRTADAVHMLDLDVATYEHRPLPFGGERFDDRVWCHLLRSVVEWPRLGEQFKVRYWLRSDPRQRNRSLESGVVLGIDHARPAVDELADILPGVALIRIPSGWVPLVRHLHADLVELEPRYLVTAVKEKFGRLRFYIALPEQTSPAVVAAMYDRIDWAEDEAGSRCTRCGAPVLPPGTVCNRHGSVGGATHVADRPTHSG